ncbi:MAG: hypothetical protein RIS64_4565 [Bacteroidota bacterium]|jgi:ABC-type uncharacterized transport system ATPase subunit
MKHRKQNFIRSIQVKNYKSIQDLTIELHAGLNILIGSNGTGKTNFVNAVNSVFTEKLHAELPIGFEFEFEFVNKTDEMVTWSGNIQEKISKNKLHPKLKTPTYHSEATDGTDLVANEDGLFGNPIFDFLLQRKIISRGYSLSSFGHLAGLAYVNEMKPLTIYTQEQLTSGAAMHDMGFTYFALQSIPLPSKATFKTVQKILKINPLLMRYLAHLSEIKNYRISERCTFEIVEKTLHFHSIVLEFFVHDRWVSWEELSDGTKRLFYLITGTLMVKDVYGCCLLIDAPELGIHPDALYKLMDFLKEQSAYTQIILTTHAPDVLNILETNELHRIIVTRMHKVQGTMMHHLSLEKIQKAQAYMEDLSLRDFWVHADLETLY